MSKPQLPQLSALPLIGHAHHVDVEAPMKSFLDIAHQIGPVFEFRQPAGKVIFVGDPDVVAELCDTDRFEKSIFAILEELRNIGGDGLFTAHTTEPNWGMAHRILMPALGPIAIRDMFPQMKDIAEQMFDRWNRFSESPVDVAGDMTRLTLDTIALCGFSYRFNSFYRDEMHPFVGAMVGALKESERRTRRPKLANKLLRTSNNKYWSDIDLMAKVSDEIVQRRKRSGEEIDTSDLLGRMLAGRDPETGETLPDENIRNQMITFLIAGHETTSGLLSFATYLLLKNPEVLEEARALVDEVLGQDEITVHHLHKLELLEQIFLETLRLWPTAPAFGVKPKRTTTIDGQYEVTPEEPLVVLVQYLHRSPKVWRDPDTFDPSRFAPGNREKIPPHAFKPFGNGNRACIGRSFAMQEATIVLAMMLQQFEFELADPNYELVVKETLTLKPDGLQIRVRARDISGLKSSDAGPSHVSILPGEGGPKVDGETLTILFGSDTGTSESFAKRLAKEGESFGFKTSLCSMDDALESDGAPLTSDGTTLLVTSSYLGKPPRNAQRYVEALSDLPAKSLEGARFAIFGCGDRNWLETYQAVPQEVEAGLLRAGAEQIVTRGEGDASLDLMEAFAAWRKSLWRTLSGGAETLESAPLKIEVVQNAGPGPEHLRYATVIESRELANADSPHFRPKRHLELALPEGMSYRPGDYLTVLPENPPDVVERALRRFTLQPVDALRFDTSSDLTYLPLGQTISARELFARYVELSAPVSRSQLTRMAKRTRCPPEQKELAELLENYEDTFEKRVSLLELAERFPSYPITLEEFLSSLSPIQPRQYSISSSPSWRKDHCTLTVSVVEAPARSGNGRYQGIASTFLARSKPGDVVRVAVSPARDAFRLPEDSSTPIVMVAAGSGIAPFRGFLQERAEQKRRGDNVGDAWLFFGCDHPEADLLYKNEVEAWEEASVVRFRGAFAEAKDGDITFVQHRLWKEREEFAAAVAAGAKVYVCGAPNMARGVKQTIEEIVADQAKAFASVGIHDAKALMKAPERYAEDIFA